jgi:hypothetical protein
MSVDQIGQLYELMKAARGEEAVGDSDAGVIKS